MFFSNLMFKNGSILVLDAFLDLPLVQALCRWRWLFLESHRQTLQQPMLPLVSVFWEKRTKHDKVKKIEKWHVWGSKKSGCFFKVLRISFNWKISLISSWFSSFPAGSMAAKPFTPKCALRAHGSSGRWKLSMSTESKRLFSPLALWLEAQVYK